MEDNIQLEEPDVLIKKLKVQHTGRQFTLAIPVDVIDALDIEKGDTFTISIPLKNKKDYSIRLDKEV